MKRSEAARYASWSAALALLLVSVTGAVYLRRFWGEYRDRKNAPAPAPADVDRQSSAITFSKVDGPLTIFTVQASKSINFKGKDDSRLEDVRITIFGKTGARHDVLHTQSCQYSSENISCSGIVQIDMQSAAESASGASPAMTVETRGVSFDRASGFAQTKQPVKFLFPNGTGQAVGVQYRSDEGTLRLLNDIQLVVVQPGASYMKGYVKGSAKGERPKTEANAVLITGSSLVFDRGSRTMNLAGPARAETGVQKLTGGEMALALDETFHAQRLVVTGGAASSRPELTSQNARGSTELVADKMTAEFAPEGWVARVEAAGAVKGKLQNSAENDELSAEDAKLEMWPRVSEPKMVELTGNVDMKTRTSPGGDVRTLQTGALRVEFSGGRAGKASHPVKAETLSAGAMEWTDELSTGDGAKARTKLQGDKLAVDFGAEGKASALVATGNVITERAVAGKPLQSAKAMNGTAQLAPGGGWTQMELRGSVRLKEGERSAKAEHAVFLRGEQSATLTGEAAVSDGATQTRAQRIIFLQSTGEIRGEGGVRSTDFSSKGNAPQLAATPIHLSSDAMQANTKTGRAIYTGHARMWQGETVVEADSIELVKDAKEVQAKGNVRGVFPQMSRKGTVLWHVSAATMTYNDMQSRARLEQSASVQSADQRIRAQAMDLFFTRTTGGKTVGGSQQISRAVGTGGVVVEQGGRRGTADRGEYTAVDGKFVLSGGSPTLFDSVNGTTTGRELTFFFADDTIIVDSENGSRTVTKHRVER
jgi:lipopolysaccharide export system protein LptA